MKSLKYIILFLALITSASVFGKGSDTENVDMKYRRSSLYSVLVSHDEQPLAKEIKDVFIQIPTPDKYNNHDLSVKILGVDKNGEHPSEVKSFIERSDIASRMVCRWFDRNKFTGECSTDLIKERGLYNASEVDKELASRSARGKALLEDAGEDLIKNTFLLVNEVHYIDNAKRSRLVGGILSLAGNMAANITGISAINDLGNAVSNMVSTIKGFRVKIHTYLYQLNWNDECAMDFYRNGYSAKPDAEKQKYFENNRSKFTLNYLGDVVSSGSTTSFMGISEQEPELMIRKACQRAIDDNVCDLQKKYDQFKVKSPITSVQPTIRVGIGLKEGLNKNSKFEVLEAQEKDGKIVYKRVGVIKPVPSLIWDNRYMAHEEGAYGADFGATTFEKVSGSDFYPGLLVREIQ